MPADDFKRNAATIVADLFADAVLAGTLAGVRAVANLQRVCEITESADMPDPSRAKLHKSIAYGMAGKTTLAGQPGNWADLTLPAARMVLTHLVKAEQLHESSGVKADIKAVQRHIAQLEGKPDPSADTAAGDSTASTPVPTAAPAPSPANKAKAPAAKKPAKAKA